MLAGDRLAAGALFWKKRMRKTKRKRMLRIKHESLSTPVKRINRIKKKEKEKELLKIARSLVSWKNEENPVLQFAQ
jgi:hypothetical protein